VLAVRGESGINAVDPRGAGKAGQRARLTGGITYPAELFGKRLGRGQRRRLTEQPASDVQPMIGDFAEVNAELLQTAGLQVAG